jgi:rRNA large subunit m3Psi methyltransferase RlmH
VDLVLLAVGKLRPSYREACDDYLRRLGRYQKVKEVEVREASRAPTIAAQRAEEGERLLARWPAGSRLVALARQGTEWSSEELARQVARWQREARPVALIIGGVIYLSYGLAFLLGFIGLKLVFHAMHENELPFINGGEPIPWAPEIPIWLAPASQASVT